MSCTCGEEYKALYISEVCVHPPVAKDLSKPAVMLFPEVTICLKCGFASFSVPKEELRKLEKGAAA